MKISIIIITYNRPDDTLALIQDIVKLRNLEMIANIVILNNNSTENYQRVESFITINHAIPFRYEKSSINLGVAGGRNLATRFAEGELFLYLDDDILLPDPFTLNKVLSAFQLKVSGNREVGVVNFRVLYSANLEVQRTAFPHKKYNKYKVQHSFLTSYYSGCAHAKSRKAWYDTGPYPEDFFYGMEEYDFSYRLIDKNYCILFLDSLTVIHKESPLGRKTKAEKLKMMWVNKSKVAWRYLPFRFFLSTSILWSIYYLIKSGWNISLFIAGYREIINLKMKRTPISSKSLQYLRSVDARLLY